LTDKSTKKRFPLFSLTNLLVNLKFFFLIVNMNTFFVNINKFSKYEQILILMAATHPQKIGTETK